MAKRFVPVPSYNSANGRVFFVLFSTRIHGHLRQPSRDFIILMNVIYSPRTHPHVTSKLNDSSNHRGLHRPMLLYKLKFICVTRNRYINYFEYVIRRHTRYVFLIVCLYIRFELVLTDCVYRQIVNGLSGEGIKKLGQ